MTTALTELAAHPLVERLGWTLVHFVWQAMVVSVFAEIALRVFRNASANVRYVGLCAGLLVLAASPAVTFVTLPTEAELDSVTHVESAARESVDPMELSRELTPPLAAGRHVAARDHVVAPEEQEGTA